MRYYKIINEEIVFFEGNVLYTETETIINPSAHQLVGEGWSPYNEPIPSDEQLLQEAKLNKIQEIETYDQSSSVNEFYLGSIPMWLDSATRQQLRISIEAYQAIGAENVTKWFNGEEFTFPISLWFQMLNALEVYAAEALNVTESHKSAINSLETIEEIEQFDITQGYPEKLNLMPR